MAATSGLIEAAEATANPLMLSIALLAYSYAFRKADPAHALDAAHRGLVIAQDSGSRCSELATSLAIFDTGRGDIASALDHVTLAIRNYHDSGSTALMRSRQQVRPLPICRLM